MIAEQKKALIKKHYKDWAAFVFKESNQTIAEYWEF